ncbi:MAG: hypothetical protein AAF320_02470 [Myxococcota bacterium]
MSKQGKIMKQIKGMAVACLLLSQSASAWEPCDNTCICDQQCISDQSQEIKKRVEKYAHEHDKIKKGKVSFRKAKTFLEGVFDAKIKSEKGGSHFTVQLPCSLRNMTLIREHGSKKETTKKNNGKNIKKILAVFGIN